VKEKDSKIEHSHQLILYVEKEDASYGPLQTGSYMACNYLGDYFEKRQTFLKNRRQELLDGRISPIAFYMDLVELAEGDLASRVGMSRRKVRYHMTPEGFAKLTLKTLLRYAEVLTVPPAMLLQILEYDPARIQVSHSPTQQELFTLIHIEATEGDDQL
jgi:hypothetical protein